MPRGPSFFLDRKSISFMEAVTTLDFKLGFAIGLNVNSSVINWCFSLFSMTLLVFLYDLITFVVKLPILPLSCHCSCFRMHLDFHGIFSQSF